VHALVVLHNTLPTGHETSSSDDSSDEERMRKIRSSGAVVKGADVQAYAAERRPASKRRQERINQRPSGEARPSDATSVGDGGGGTLAHALVVLHNTLPTGHETSHNGLTHQEEHVCLVERF
jgi:hypothetical protein